MNELTHSRDTAREETHRTVVHNPNHIGPPKYNILMGYTKYTDGMYNICCPGDLPNYGGEMLFQK